MVKPGDKATVTIISKDGYMHNSSVYVGNKCIDEGRISYLNVEVEPDCVPIVTLELHPTMVFSYVEPIDSGATVATSCELTHKLTLQKKRGLARVKYLSNRGLNSRGILRFDHINKRV